MLTVDRVEKRFGPNVALEEISFTADSGIVALAGPNGAGKSTLVRILSGAILPTSGTVTLDGIDTSFDSIAVRRLTGAVFENAPMYSGMTVSRYLEFVAGARGYSKKEARERVNRALATCALGEVAQRLTDHLSRGFRQRTALAAALIHDPRLLILDEPSSGLDPVQLAEFWKLIQSFSNDRVIVISTHNMTEIERLGAFVILLNRGKVLEKGTVADILAEAREENLTDAFVSLVSREAHNG
jgi:ABC-2 type transport system ATP-binding protein